MKKIRIVGILIAFFIGQHAFAQKDSQAFFIRIYHDKMTVSAPVKKMNSATIVVQNYTRDRVVAKIRSGNKTLSRLALFPKGDQGDTHTLTLDFRNLHDVHFVPLAPAFESLHLKFGEQSYEVP